MTSAQGQGDLGYSIQMRDIIERIAVQVIERERPRYRYARVQKINYSARTCDVIFNGETGVVRVNMGSIQPSAVNQIVRVEGIGVDKYVTDVIGDALQGVRVGRIQPLYTSGKPYVTWDGETALSGPYEIYSGYNPSQYDVVQGIFIPGRGYVLYPVQDFVTNMPYARWYPLPLSNGWVEYDGFYGTPKFTKNSAGIVKVQGLLKNGTNVGGETIGTLPPGFRPARKMIIGVGISGYGGSVDVFEDGTIKARNCSAAFTSLDNISFPCAEVMPASAITPVAPYQNSWKDYIDQYPTDALNWPRGGVWRDSDGCAWETGLLWKGGVSSNDETMYVLNSNYACNLYMHRRTTAGNNQVAFLYKRKDTIGSTGYGLITNTASGYCSLDGTPYFPDNSGSKISWNGLGFQNGWINYDTSFYQPGQYTKTKSNHVHLRGLVKSGAAGSVIAVLPPGYRPARRLLMSVISNGSWARLDINTDGSVIPMENFSSTWGSLDSVNFMAEQ